ncbi:MAG: excalibur calcium-binding domain-containing protein, partial [Sphingomicrobium sp.]
EIIIVVGLLGAATAKLADTGPPSTVSDPRPIPPDRASPSGISPPPPRASDTSVFYAGCNEVRALGKAPLYAGQPGYREDMDGDGDGIACEPHRGR